MHQPHQGFAQHQRSVIEYLTQAPFTKIVELKVDGDTWGESLAAALRDAYPGFIDEIKGVQRAHLAGLPPEPPVARLSFPDEDDGPLPPQIFDCLMVDREPDRSILMLLGSDRPLPRLLMAEPRPWGARLRVLSIAPFTKRSEWVERVTEVFSDVYALRGEVVPDGLLEASLRRTYKAEPPTTRGPSFA